MNGCVSQFPADLHAAGEASRIARFLVSANTQCGMQLWVTAIPRPMRFHDTRHTYGTLLAQGGFDGV